MSYNLSQLQIEDLTALADADNWAAFYDAIYLLTVNVDGESVDPMVREWFRAASKANAGVGAESDLISVIGGAILGHGSGGIVLSRPA